MVRFYLFLSSGGTSLAQYFKMVAHHYGLEYQAAEWGEAEEPANNRESSTFYVTHLREPVDRAVSHFKCMFATTIL